jgi:hypothetical protein
VFTQDEFSPNILLLQSRKCEIFLNVIIIWRVLVSPPALPLSRGTSLSRLSSTDYSICSLLLFISTDSLQFISCQRVFLMNRLLICCDRLTESWWSCGRSADLLSEPEQIRRARIIRETEIPSETSASYHVTIRGVLRQATRNQFRDRVSVRNETPL